MTRLSTNWPIRIIGPASMALVLFISALFVFILPMIRESMLEHKREMCRALSESGWSVLKYYHERESAGELTRDEAQAQAMAEIGSMRYGPDMKDYFWITDMHPRLVMHPYRSDLVDIDLTEFTDQDGKLFFMEFVSVVEESGAGYVDYVWQWQDDPDITSHKFSYVKHFEPWGWILGTGIYLEDVTEHINRLNARLVLICTAILILVSALLVYTVLQSLRTEAQRRRAELATEQYARRLQAVIGSTPEGFWMIDSDLRTVDVNEALTRMLGYTREEMIGEFPYAFVDEENAEILRKWLGNLDQLGNQVYELEYTRRDGTKLPVLVNGSTLVKDGTDGRAFAFLTDISELKNTEQQLRESEERYRQLIETAPIGIIIHRDGVIEFSNHAAIEWIGLPNAEAARGRRIAEFIAPESREDAIQHITKVNETGQTVSPATAYFQHMSGYTLYAEVASTPITLKGSQAVLTVILDKTKRRESERELKRLFTAIEQADEIFLVTDLDFRIMYANPALERVTETPTADTIGRLMPAVLCPEGTSESFASASVIAVQGRTWRGSLECRTKQGTHHILDVTISPVIDEMGVISNYVAVMHDVTRETALQEQLRQSQKLEAIGTLAGGIAHDFNNILFAIIGYSDLALDNLPEDSETHMFISQIIRSAKRAGELVRQILSFARQSKRERFSVPLMPVIQEVLKMLRSTLPSNISITTQFNVDELLVHADPTELHQIVMNLCTNAGHAMVQTGGSIGITVSITELAAGDTIGRLQLAPGQYAVLAVADTGQGIPDEIAARVFEPFFTTKDQGQGTGMGLSVVHGIVTALKGNIVLESELDQGTTFTVYLPLATGKSAGSLAEAAKIPGGSEHIMVVDDEEAIRVMLHRVLEKLGYRVTSFHSSMEALSEFQRDPQAYDVVITDQTMPQLTGVELARRMLKQRSGLPVILTTGYSQSTTPELAQAAGIRAYLTKPTLKTELAETIRRVLATPSG